MITIKVILITALIILLIGEVKGAEVPQHATLCYGHGEFNSRERAREIALSRCYIEV
jgi:hypothetical protein